MMVEWPVAPPGHHRVRVQGLDCHGLCLPGGDRVLVAEHGAHALSWVSGGREQLYLSPLAVLDGRAAIRGGVPVCWPQFSDRGSLPRHGWVRQSHWSLASAELTGDVGRLVFCLDAAVARPAGAAPWPYVARLEMELCVRAGELSLRLHVHNQGAHALPFTGALHTYLALEDATNAVVTGWAAARAHGWDSVRGEACDVVPQLPLAGEVDRILPVASGPLTVVDGAQRLHIEQGGWGEVVVWNPGAEKCAALADMPDGDERRMACVEAAQARAPLMVAPGQVWTGWQRLRVAAAS